VLRLNGNPLTSSGVQRLAIGVGVNRALEVLSLQGCLLARPCNRSRLRKNCSRPVLKESNRQTS